MNNHVPFPVGFLAKIPLAFGLGLLNVVLINIYNRYKEYKADDSVPSTEELLHGGITLMNHEQIKENKVK